MTDPICPKYSFLQKKKCQKADDNLHESLENFVVKGQNASNQHFGLVLQVFQKAISLGASKLMTVRQKKLNQSAVSTVIGCH